MDTETRGKTADTKALGWKERLLSPFAKVEAGEAGNVVLMTVCVFMILCAYYVLKTSREGLILTGGVFGLKGAELKIYASGAMAVLLMGLIPAYSALANKVSRLRLINYSYTGVFVSLAVFFVLGNAGVPIGLPFLIWLGLVSVFLIAQFWSYANDIYNEEQGKRLFAVIAIGGSAGAIVGPKLTTLADTYTLMLVAAGILGGCLVLFNFINRNHAAKAVDGAKAKKDDEGPTTGAGGFTLIMKDRYLLLIGVMVLIANLVNSMGEFLLSTAAAEHAAALVPGASNDPAVEDARREIIKAFYGDFFFWVNLVGFLIQAFLVSRIIRWIGVRGALFIMPIVAFGTYGAIALIGGLMITRTMKVAENSTDYSLHNTVRQALFLPTSRAAKYKAKAAIDVFFVRFGDTLSAIIVGVGLHSLDIGVRGLAMVNVGMCAIWILIVIGIARRHRELAKTAEGEAKTGAGATA
ncbi:MAG: Npt1/Npt2 family nucleotide transporter, partial [Polyangiales bacterium]